MGIAVAVLPSSATGLEFVGLVVLGLLVIGMLRARVLAAGIDWLAPPMLFAAVVGLYYLARPAGLLAGVAAVGGDKADMDVAMALVFAAAAGFWVGYLLRVGEAWGGSMAWPARGSRPGAGPRTASSSPVMGPLRRPVFSRRTWWSPRP